MRSRLGCQQIDDQERKKREIVSLLESLLDRVERDQFYGEFGISFCVQNGQIGSYEEHARRTFK